MEFAIRYGFKSEIFKFHFHREIKGGSLACNLLVKAFQGTWNPEKAFLKFIKPSLRDWVDEENRFLLHQTGLFWIIS